MDLDRITLVEEKKTYEASVEYCRHVKRDGTLVSVKTREDMDKICNKYSSTLYYYGYDPVRIGLYFKGNVGRWQDGEIYDVNNNITVDNPENNCRMTQRCEVTMNCNEKKFEKRPINRPFPFEEDTLSSFFLCYKDLAVATTTTIAQTIIPAIPQIVNQYYDYPPPGSQQQTTAAPQIIYAYRPSGGQQLVVREDTEVAGVDVGDTEVAGVDVIGDTNEAVEATTVDDPVNPEKKPSLGLILGLVFGLLFLVLIIVLIVFCICHQKKKKQRKIDEANKKDEENGEEAAEEEEEEE